MLLKDAKLSFNLVSTPDYFLYAGADTLDR